MLIHQALHGYTQGHNRIACSMQLSSADDDRMKMLSDWSEYAGGIDRDTSYITAYPLMDGKSYVIAKTWYADEMSRPGCVWTHSLIINLNEVDEQFDFRVLLQLFRRPEDGSFEGYNTTLSTDGEISTRYDDITLTISLIPLSYIYVQLLKQERGLVYKVERNSAVYQLIILMLMQYLPLQMLSKLTFCSGSSCGRKIGNDIFNLQFTTSTGKSLVNAPEFNGLQVSNFNEGVIYICNSLLCNISETSQFLRIFAADLEDNSTKICAFGILLSYLDKAYSHVDVPEYRKVINIIADAFPTLSEGKKIKYTFISEKIATLFSSKDDYYYLMCTFESESIIDLASAVHIDSIHRYLSESPDKLIDFLNKLIGSDSLNSLGKAVLKNEADNLNEDLQRKIADGYWNLYKVLLSLNTTMLGNDYWLSFLPNKVDYLLPIFGETNLSEFKHWKELFVTCIDNNIELPASVWKVMHQCCPDSVLLIMDHLQNQQSFSLPISLIRFCEEYSQDMLKWMSFHSHLSNSNITFILQAINPEEVETKAAGSEPWRFFVYHDTEQMDIRYYIFMFVLSFNWRDELSLYILKHSFFNIHESLSRDEVPTFEMNKLQRYMAELPVWQWWDNCKKLRRGIVQYIKYVGYERKVLEDFTPSQKINDSLLKIWDRL